MRQRPPRLRVGKPREMPMAVAPERAPGSTHERGYGWNWQQARRVALNREPLCRYCMERGMVTAATEVDHIRALRDGGDNALDNLAPCCHECHLRKTMRDVSGRKRRQTGGGGDSGPPLA